MTSKNGLNNFVIAVMKEFHDFDFQNHKHLKELIRKSIDYYQMKSYEKKEDVEKETLYLASMAEENMLAKIMEIVIGPSEEAILEFVYDSRVVRIY